MWEPNPVLVQPPALAVSWRMADPPQLTGACMDPPQLSPLSGAYLMIVVGEPFSEEHKQLILRKIEQGKKRWFYRCFVLSHLNIENSKHSLRAKTQFQIHCSRVQFTFYCTAQTCQILYKYKSLFSWRRDY